MSFRWKFLLTIHLFIYQGTSDKIWKSGGNEEFCRHDKNQKLWVCNATNKVKGSQKGQISVEKPPLLMCDMILSWGIVLRASSGIPASYLTCGSSIIQVMLASFKYLLEHKVLKIFSFIYNSSSNNCLPYVFIQDIVIAKSKKLKKNSQF